MSGMPPDDLPEWARDGSAPVHQPQLGQQHYAPQPGQPRPGQQQYHPQPANPQQYVPQAGQQPQPQPGQQQLVPQPGQPQYAPQPGQPHPGQHLYVPRPAQPQPAGPQYASQPGQAQYAMRPGQPQQYVPQPQPGQPQPGQPQPGQPQPGQPQRVQQYAPGVYPPGTIPTATKVGVPDPSWPGSVAAPPAVETPAKGSDYDLPPMPGGWYQPPTAEDLSAASAAPPVPLGTGPGLAGPPSYAQVLPGTDPLVSFDLNSWVTKVAGALGRSWKGLLSINALGTIGSVAAGVASFVVASKVVGIDKLIVDDPGGSAISVLIVLLATFTAYFFGTLVTQAASAYVMVKDAEEGKGRFRLGGAFSFGLRSLQRLAWGMFGSFLIYLAFAIGAGGILLVVAMALGSQGLGVMMLLAAVLYMPVLYLIVTIQTSLVGVAAFEDAPVIGRSLARIKGRWWPMFVRQIMVGVVVFMVGQVALQFSGISNFIQLRSSEPTAKVGLSMFGIGITFLAMMVGLSIQAAAYLVSYCELRSHSDGGGITPLLAKECW
jgi:hypothetical protein